MNQNERKKLMDKYEKTYELLAKRLKNGDQFGLRMGLDGEGKFKDFYGEQEIPVLKEFLENARKENIKDIIIRNANAEESIVSEF